MAELISEPWTYKVDGEAYEGRKVWYSPPPGPVGCGIVYLETDTFDVLADDGVWERHVVQWQAVNDG